MFRRLRIHFSVEEAHVLGAGMDHEGRVSHQVAGGDVCGLELDESLGGSLRQREMVAGQPLIRQRVVHSR